MKTLSEQSQAVFEKTKCTERQDWSEKANWGACNENYRILPIVEALLQVIDGQREALVGIAEDRLHSEHYGSEVKEKVYRRASAKEAITQTDKTMRELAGE